MLIDTFKLIGLTPEARKIKIDAEKRMKLQWRAQKSMTIKQKAIIKAQEKKMVSHKQEKFELENCGRYKRIYPVVVEGSIE
jgi:hypothetical protein